MSNELTDVRCSCGDEYPADSYDAGFIAGSGMCQNCDAALPPKDICTCPSGNGSLRHPCPAHPAVEQAGGDERAAFELFVRKHCGMPEHIAVNWDAKFTNDAWEGWKARAALAQPSPVRSSLLINGYQLRAALEFIAPDGTAKQLESEARIEWRQQDADFLEAGLYAWCAEYPEEGCVLLDEEPATAQPSQDAPYADGIADALERSDWTPKEALHWYAEGKHFDTVAGRTRVIDTGAVASNALKHLSLPYLEMKGDAELTELREAHAQPSPKCATCNDQGHVCLDWEAGAWEKCPDCAQTGERSPMAVMAEALRDKARKEQQEYQDRRAQAEVKLDFSRPLETENGEPVKWICADVIEYKSARVCVAKDTGLVYSSPYIGLKIRNVMPEQAEAERPEVVGVRYEDGTILSAEDCGTALEVCAKVQTPLMTVAQHERIVGALRAERDGAIKLLGQSVWQKIERLTQERDAALARVAELERGKVYVEARRCDECQHGGINDSATGVAACHECDWTGPEPEEDKCPGCQRENCMAAACPQCGARYVLVASEEIAAPVAQAQHSAPEVSGIGRDTGHPRAVVLYLRKEPTDDDLRAIHDALRSLAAAPGKEGV